MPEVKASILAALAYFDNFRYPLTLPEIHSFLSHPCSLLEAEMHLAALLQAGAVFRLYEYYSLRNDTGIVQRRKTGYQHAVRQMQTARKIARLLSCFPFVRGVAISGSLSKYYADEHSDTDFFLITAGNRLWLARSFTHVAKKISFLFRKEHLFCMNYYIDEYEPVIAEQNIFTATEVVTLIPVEGMSAFILFNQANSWTRRFLPNHLLPAVPVTPLRRPVLTRCIETLLNNALGEWLDTRLMRLTAKRWTAKQRSGQCDDHGLPLRMQTGKHFSKPDPSLFQEKIIHHYRQRTLEVTGHQTV